ncbi:MAG: tRNA (guanosine(46)-N7)-methyltransferase TrmB [Bacteroidetes bacterium]|nr:tRNA (guanosine(46)-N7)-methyltransferase TrmB [Bacteroidota bacterium]HET6244765.1 tRNA (guanosine(46)-N7)-methyltransferase TrmB [Bacteroidia bacterium]
MAKRKMERFAEVDAAPNVIQHVQVSADIDDHFLKGKWNEEYFKNDLPIVLELGCGKGEYTLGLAQRFIDKNFLGLDIKGARIWKGSKTALEKNLTNVAFIRTTVDRIEKLFGKNEVDEIWITFPDPQPQKPKERKRLTCPQFINKYKNTLKEGGIIHLKTDNKPFYEYTLEVIKQEKYELLIATDNLYNEKEKLDLPEGLLEIKTFYESMFTAKGFNICYLKFRI